MKKSRLTAIKNRLASLKQFSLRLRKTAEKSSLWALFFYALVASLLLPLPIDTMLTGLIIGSPKRWLRLTFAFASASVMGGVATYGIGYAFINLIGGFLIHICGGGALWQSLVGLLQSGHGTTYLATVSLLAGPYKLSFLAAGATGMKFSLIMLILLITRTSRFLVIGISTRFVGHWLPRLRNLWKQREINHEGHEAL